MSKSRSTIEVGNGFRDMVADLLRASGLNPIVEVQIGSKRVDIYFEESRFGRTRRFGVEAKNYQKPLVLGDLEKIFAGYSVLLGREIDEILVISPHMVASPAAQRYLQDHSQISHITPVELQENLLGFSAYLEGVVHRHGQFGLEDYFVRPELEEGGDLIDHVGNWLSDGDANPMAIIASYGMGKTSLGQHLTYNLARAYLAEKGGRIPIYVSLGAISREQGLEGLIATTLTSGAPAVRNFNFPLFEKLNDAGRFFIILDGFDEMKHMMSELEFYSNFDELNRLVRGKAKILLLGRPSAFLSENEHDYVLRGVRRIAGRPHRSPGAVQYTQVGIAPFRPEQVRRFLVDYFRYNRNAGRIPGDDAWANARTKQLETSDHDELMSRPVHARMLADLASDPAFEVGHLTRFQLYDHFVDHLIARETTKLGRGRLLKQIDRRAFSCDLAWYLWTDPGSITLGCRIEDLPKKLFKPYLPSSEDATALRRALLSGSFLDEKSSGVFYFAHRSFQEFLVAEYIWGAISSGSRDSRRTLSLLGVAMTKEVFDFIGERDDKDFFRSLLDELDNHKARLSLEVFVQFSSSSRIREIATWKGLHTTRAWDACVQLCDALVHNPMCTDELLRLGQQIAKRASRKPRVRFAALSTVLHLYASQGLADVVVGQLLVAIMFGNGMDDIRSLKDSAQARRTAEGPTSTEAIFGALSAGHVQNQGLTVSLDIGALCRVVGDHRPEPIDLPVTGIGLRDKVYRARFDTFFALLPSPERRLLREFYEDELATKAPPDTSAERGGTRFTLQGARAIRQETPEEEA